MKVFLLLTLLLLGLPAMAQQVGYGPTFTTVNRNPYISEEEQEKMDAHALQADRIENIYCAYGYTTKIKLNTEKRVERLVIGSEIASVKYNETDNSIDIFPAVTEGQTNMNVTVDGVTYVFMVKIAPDQEIMYRRTFTFPLEEAAKAESLVVRRPPVKPEDIDVVFYIQALEQTRLDPNYYKAMKNRLRVWPQDRVYHWNGCSIHLIESAQFLRDDLVVLKIEWQNLTEQALYLDVSQIEVYVANEIIPVTASSQISNLLFPGQRDVMYLFIQGYGKSGDNAFELKLPPQAAGLRRLMETY